MKKLITALKKNKKLVVSIVSLTAAAIGYSAHAGLLGETAGLVIEIVAEVLSQ